MNEVKSLSRTAHGVCLLLLLLLLLEAPVAAQPVIRTVLGTGRSKVNATGGPRETNLGNPFGVEVGPDGALYVTEVTNHRVWRFEPKTDELRVIAGVGRPGYRGDGGLAAVAELNEPYEIRFDADGNIYFVEMQNHVVRRIEAKTGIISTVAGTGRAGFGGDGMSATKAQLNRPHSIALDAKGNLYIADLGNHRIRRVDRATGLIDSIAGDGEKRGPVDKQLAGDRPVHGPRALFIVDDTLWVALREGNSVWKLQPSGESWIWHHVAGTGEKGYSGDGADADSAVFNGPKGIAVGPRGNVFVVDTENQVIRMIDTQHGTIATLAGRGPEFRGFAGDMGPAAQASLNRPHGICVDSRGRVYIGDSENHRVRLIE